MSPNSHIVNWLRSVYRGILHRQRVGEARRAVAAEVFERPMIERMESLENRVMLSTVPFVDFPVASYTANPTIQANMQTVLKAGINKIADAIDTNSAAGNFSTDVPGILKYSTFGQAPTAVNLSTLLGSIGGLGGVIKSNVATPIGNVPVGSGIGALNLAPVDLTVFGIHTQVNVGNAKLTAPASGDVYKLTVDVSVTVTDNDVDGLANNLYFDLGRNADQLGIRPTMDNQYFPAFGGNSVNVKAGMSVSFTAGVDVTITDLGGGSGSGNDPAIHDTQIAVADDNSGFFMRDGSVLANAFIDTAAQGISPTAAFEQLGFLDVNLTLKSFKLDGHLREDLQDSVTHSNVVTYAGLSSLTHTAQVATGTISSEVDITVDQIETFANNFDPAADAYQLNFFGTPLGASVSSIPGSGDHRTAPQVKFNDAAEKRLEPYKNVTAGGVAGMIKAYADKLGSLPASSVLNAKLPLVTGKSLGDLIPLGNLISSHLIFDNSATPSSAGTKLLDGNGNASFTSFQSLVSRISALTGLPVSQINPTLVTANGANQVVLTIGLDLGAAPLALSPSQGDINLNLDQLEPFAGLTSTAKVTLTPSGHVGFTFGIDVNAAGTSPIVIASPVTNTRLIGVVNGSGAVQTPANGRLTGDAVFKLTVGGSPNGNKSFQGGVATVTLKAADTAANNTRADLVAQLQAAINAALDKLDTTLPNPVSKPLTGKLLVKVGVLADGRITLTSEFTGLLKVASVSGGTVGFGQLGFVDNQAGASAPTPATGRLSGNATFKLRIGESGSLVSVSLPQADTLGNTTIAQLVAQLDAKVNAATGGKVRAVQAGNGVMLQVDSAVADVDPAHPVRLLEVVDPSAAVLSDLGWQDRQLSAEVSTAGRDELSAAAQTLTGSATNGKPGATVSFTVTVDGEQFSVDVLQTATSTNKSNTGDNTSLSDLAADINAAFGTMKLANGRLLGSVISASAVDVDNSDGNGTADTIVFRSTADIGAFSVAPVSGGAAIGLAGTVSSTRVGPTNALPAGGATITITVGDQAPVQITVTPPAAGSDPVAELVKAIQAQMDATALNGHLVVGRAGNHLVFADPFIGDRQIRITLDHGTAAGRAAETVLGLQDNQTARASGNVEYFVQDAGVHLGVTVAVTNAKASGHVGFVGVDVGDIDASASLDLDIKLQDNSVTPAASRIDIDKIGSNLTDISITAGSSLPASLATATSFAVSINGGAAVTVNVAGGANSQDEVVQHIQAGLDAAAGALGAQVRASVSKSGKLVLTVSALQAKKFDVTTGSVALGLGTGGGFSLLVPLTASWSGSLDVKGITVKTGIPGLESIAIPDQHLNAGNGLAGVALFNGPINIPQDLKNFLNVAFDAAGAAGKIIDGLQNLADFFNGNFDSLPFLGTKIPVINQSLADLLNVGNSFQKVVDAFKANPTDSVQGLRNRLIEALNLPTDTNGVDDPTDPVHVKYDAASKSLMLDLTFFRSFNNTLPIDFNHSLLGNLPFDLKGNAALEVDGSATAKLGIGVDLSDPLHPVFFLNTDPTHTTFGLTFAARGSDLSFNLSFGPAGLAINDGQLAIDADGNPLTKNDPLKFDVTLSDNDGTSDNRVSFTNLLSNLNSVGIHAGAVTGKLNATLPIFFPTDSDFLGNLGLQVDNLGGFLTTGDTSLVHVQVPDLSNIVNNLNFNLLDNLPLLIDGVDSILAKLQTLLDKTIGSANLPLVGGGIHDAAQFIAKIRSTVFENLRAQFTGAATKTEQVITNALTQIFTDLGILQGGINVNKSLTGNTATDHVEWNLGLGQSITLGSAFDLGLPILGLKSSDPISVGLNWHVNLGFGLDFTHGFYFKINAAPNTPEVTANITLDLPSTITGNLLFFKLTATDKHPGHDATAGFSLDLSSSDDKVGIADLGNLTFTPKLTGSADISLHLKAGINAGGLVSDKFVSALPSIVADLNLSAGFTLPAVNGNAFTLSHVSMDHIGLDLGSFFSEFLSPLVQGIKQATQPLQPFIDVFTAPIPVISDLAGQPVTLLDVASLFGDVDPGMLEAVAKLVTLINSIPDASKLSGGLIIPFGSVTLVNGTAGDFNLFDTHALDSVKQRGSALTGRFGDAVNQFNSGGGFGGALGNAFNDNGTPTAPDPEVSSFATGLGNNSIADFIDFPILNDPSQIIGALFGRPFTLVTLDLPAFSFGFSYSQFFPIVGPLGASITGSLAAKFDFAFGYDSFGLQKFAEGGFKHPLDIFRGFYISDTANADGTGADVNEVEITGSLVGSAELNLGVAKGSVGGGVKVAFGLNLNDPNHDGKIRIEELVNNIRYAEPAFNPLGIFDLNVKVDAFLTWAVEVLFVFKATGQIGPSLPLLDITIPLPHKSVLATDVGGGVLRLNTGAFSGDRLNNDVSDGDETITVKQVGPGKFLISGFGETDQEYTGVSSIEAFGGQGNDKFTFIDVTVPVSVEGGQGDDLIDFTQSSGPLTARGGTGNDTILGGSGADNLGGDDGADLIVGGGGADLLHGDGGNDTLSGDGGKDTVYGDAGDDKLAGGADDDFISGGTGADEAWGDATFTTSGAFQAAAVNGNDTLSGDEDKDTLHGDGGNDRIGGGGAADLIEGGLGADTIYGDSTYVLNATTNVAELKAPLPQTAGGDRIYGESEAASLAAGVGTDGGDVIHGEAGNDFIRGNSGNDTVFGDDGNDILFGDQGNDSIEGGDGGDIAFGGADNDTVLGQAGSDVLFGDDGLVVYYNFPGFTGYQGDRMVGGNRLIGDGDPSIVPAATGFDSDVLSRDLIITDVRDSDGNDYVDGAAGNDVALGGRGDDHVFGDGDPAAAGFDSVTAPAGDDILFGDGGQVRYVGHLPKMAATVTPDKGGNDSLFGNNGNDLAFGGAGQDKIHGGHGTGVATKGSDKDILIGDNGEVDFTNGKRTAVFTTNEGVGGSDVIDGNEDDDIALGGAAGDTITGNAGNDVLIGDEGRVEFTSDSLNLAVIKTTDTFEAGGGVDDVSGNTGDDVILGGVQGDNLNGNEGKDILVGDEGQLLYNLSAAAGFDGNPATLDKVETTSFTLGGDDKITGADDDDIALGGSKNDNIKGDAPLDDPGDDVLVGDQGEVDFLNGLVTRVITTDVTAADGGVDTINGNEGRDVILGGVAGDILNGDEGNDVILGDEGQVQFNLSGGLNQDGNPLTIDNIETLQPTLGGSDVIQGNAGADIVFGGAAGDRIFGDADAPVASQDGADTLFGDGGRASLRNGVVWKLESTATGIGGSDTMEGNAGGDVMVGGAAGDEMHGDAGDVASLNPALDGNDIMLGDNGLLNWLYKGDAAFGSLEGALPGPAFDNSIATLDLITTTAPNDGGADLMFGNAGSDVMFGGTGSDLLVGDNTKGAPGAEAFGPASTNPGSDLEFGDHGRLYPQNSFLANFPSRNFFSIDTGFTAGGAGDTIFGNEKDDVQIGGQGDDQMFGNAGDDDMVGGHNVAGGIDEFEKPTGKAVNDFMDGGAGDDAMAGDNATIWRNGAALQANDLRLRFRTLNGSLLYVNGLPNITAGGHNDPNVATTRSVFLLDHTAAIEAGDATSNAGSRYGNDVMAGGADDDAIFGQLGDDMIQGDGRIDEKTLDILIFEGVKNGVVTDGNDYIEGNGGADMLIGNLGQDDIVGGSSQYFGLTTAAMRPDAGDVIFGGASTPDRVKRHAFTGDVTGDQTAFGANIVRRHAVDSDFIMGDNADVYRIVTDAGPGGVGGATAFVAFNYDKTSAYENRGDLRIVVRAYDTLDYSPIESVTTSIGGGDVIHGESGDDFIHGMTGRDILYGDAENDEIFGERDKDWLSGGTGDDAMLGDNGFVLTSRNSVAEPLYGVTPTVQVFVATPGDFLQALMNPNGRLKHAVDLEPFDQGGDDVMYGGLGSDDMHGGFGNDGISGAEALPAFYNSPETSPRVETGDIAGDKSTEIRIIPRDGLGNVNQNFYDYVNALPKLANHFLNFENDAALKAEIGILGVGNGHWDKNNGDGRDNLYGDWGDDWLVGGTGRDNMFGGMGNDLINLDDNLETDGGANDQPDNGNLIAGEPGGPAQVYDNADTAYGGGGRDVLILNTGADRAEDWVGEYNAFVVPFAPFGNGQVERSVPPAKFEFFYLLGESTGADQTRVGNLTVNGQTVFADPARRGEPFGELGLVTQKDKTAPFAWGDQNGAPIDNQAGNTPGGKRDTRGDGLSGGTSNTSAVSTATPVVDIPTDDVVDLSFSYWAEDLSPGAPPETLLWSFSSDTVFSGDSLINALKLKTSLLGEEYSWIVVPA